MNLNDGHEQLGGLEQEREGQQVQVFQDFGSTLVVPRQPTETSEPAEDALHGPAS